jgi:hypothetical protein
MQLLPSPDHDFTYSLAGATAADCVLCAVDQTCGLLVSLGLSPVLVLVGIARGPELSSGKKVPAASAAVHSVSGPLLTPPPPPPLYYKVSMLYYKNSANVVVFSMHALSHPRCECLPELWLLIVVYLGLSPVLGSAPPRL